jgi:hypothetical protein
MVDHIVIFICFQPHEGQNIFFCRRAITNHFSSTQGKSRPVTQLPESRADSDWGSDDNGLIIYDGLASYLSDRGLILIMTNCSPSGVVAL